MATVASEDIGYTKKITNINWSLATLLGITLTVATYTLVSVSLQDFELIPVYSYLFEQGPIAHVTTGAFWIGIAALVLKSFKIGTELRAFAYADSEFFDKLTKPGASITMDVAEQLLKAIENTDRKRRKLMLFNRIEKSLLRLRNTHSTSEVDDVMRALSEVDASIIETSYTAIRFVAAVIPILGFLATVYGIGHAITGFSNVLEQASSFEQVRPAMRSAIYNLGIGFNVTLLALFYSGILLLVVAVIQKKDEDLLSAVDEYCIDRLVSRVKVPPMDISELQTSLEKSTSRIVGAIEEDTYTLDKFANELKKQIEASGGGKKVEEQLEQLIDLQKAGSAGELKNVADRLAELASKMEPLSRIPSAFSGLERLNDLSHKIDEALNGLKQAVEGMSSETAREVNRALNKLLKVHVMINNLGDLNEDAIRRLNDDDRLHRLFPD